MPSVRPLNIPDFQSSIDSLNIPEPLAVDGPGAAPCDRPSHWRRRAARRSAKPLVMRAPGAALVEINVPELWRVYCLDLQHQRAGVRGHCVAGHPATVRSRPCHTEILGEVLGVFVMLWSGGTGIPGPAVRARNAWVERDSVARGSRLASREELTPVAEEFSLTWVPPCRLALAGCLRTDQMEIRDLALTAVAPTAS